MGSVQLLTQKVLVFKECCILNTARKKACHLFKQTTSLFAIGEEIWEVV